MSFAPLGFGLIWDPSTSFSVGIGMCVLCLSHCCILEAQSMCGFTGLQLEENLPQDESYLDSSHESDLGDI